MPIYTEEEVKDMSLKEKRELHEWCWYHDFGDCNKCVLIHVMTQEDKAAEWIKQGGGE